MANEKMIYASAARKAILKADPKLAYVIDSVPAVDAVEVVHGRWEEYSRMPGYLQCSKCHDAHIWFAWLKDGKWNYCPNCGAKMDGDGNG